MARTFNDIVQAMISYLRNLRPRVDTKEGTFTRDVIIDAPANEMAALYRAIDNVSNSQSPDLAPGFSLDSLGRNFQVTRNGAQKSLGTATFYRMTNPGATSILIPKGTIISTKGSINTSPIQFTTLQDITMTIANFNPNTGRWEVSVPIRALAGGAAGNVSAGTINSIISVVSNISGVYNANPTTNGQDRESDSAFVLRIKSAITGNNVGTINGYFKLATTNVNVRDAKIVDSTDTTISKRAEAGVIDILVNGSVPTQPPVETYTYTTGAPYYIPEKQPLNMASSGSFVLTGSVTGALVQGVHYSVTQDRSVYGGSVRASDRFNFLAGLTNGELITFTYTYNSLIEDIQNLVDTDTNKITNADVLVRAARARLINITATIRILPGFTATSVSNDVITNVTTFINSYHVGQEVQQSDVINAIIDTTGVDDVLVPLTRLEEDVSTGGITQDANGNLVIPADSYAIAGSIVVLVR